MSITRFSVIDDERGLMLGIDKNNIFQKGVVYECREVLGEIILTPMSHYALPKTGFPSERSDVKAVIKSCLHLFTEEEYTNSL